MQANNIQVQFLTHEVKDAKAVYLMNVKYNNESWMMNTRFSKLYEIHQNLKQLNTSVPNFPKKKFFGNLKESFLSQRQKSLEHYVVTILKYPNRYNPTPLVKYLMSGRDSTNKSTVSSNTESSKNSVQKPKGHLDEIYKSYMKTLIQIPKKNENFLIDEDDRKKKSSRLYLERKKCADRKKNMNFAQSEDVFGVICQDLDSIVNGAVAQLNGVIDEEVKLLDVNDQFVYDITKLD